MRVKYNENRDQWYIWNKVQINECFHIKHWKHDNYEISMKCFTETPLDNQ